MAADLAETGGLELPAWSSGTQQRLRGLLPELGDIHNPFHTTGPAVNPPGAAGADGGGARGRHGHRCAGDAAGVSRVRLASRGFFQEHAEAHRRTRQGRSHSGAHPRELGDRHPAGRPAVPGRDPPHASARRHGRDRASPGQDRGVVGHGAGEIRSRGRHRYADGTGHQRRLARQRRMVRAPGPCVPPATRGSGCSSSARHERGRSCHGGAPAGPVGGAEDRVAGHRAQERHRWRQARPARRTRGARGL